MTVSVPPVVRNPGLIRGLGLLAAAAVVIGDVIGTGVFLKAREKSPESINNQPLDRSSGLTLSLSKGQQFIKDVL